MAPTRQSETFDYVVVGAGSAGCVLANRLTASGRHRVLLLEAGGHDRNLWIHIPLGYGKLFSDPKVNWLYATEPEPDLNNRKIIQPRGKVLGGSSSINGLLYVRGQPEDYDHWRQLGNAGWSFEDVLPYFRRAEDQERGSDELHGKGGPLAVSNVSEPHPLCEAFIDAAQQAGFPRNDDFNGPSQEGAGYFQLTARNGRRCSTAVGYLRPARRRPNLKVVTGALATRVLFSSRRATGIEYREGDTTHIAHANAEVILAGGAFNSPQLLQTLRARPGGIAALARHRRDRRHAGRRRRFAGSSPDPHAVPLHRADHDERRVSIAGATVSAPGCVTFVQERPADHRRGLCRRLFAHPLRSRDAGRAASLYHFQRRCFRRALASVSRFHHLGLSVAAGEPRLRAHQIQPTQGSRRRSSRAIFRADRLRHGRRRNEAAAPDHGSAGDASLHRRGSARRSQHCTSDADLLAFARETGTTVFHPTSTCRMGSDPAAVVDERLRVHGIRRVARDRRLDHAHGRLRQYQCRRGDDRGKGRRHDFAGRDSARAGYARRGGSRVRFLAASSSR